MTEEVLEDPAPPEHEWRRTILVAIVATLVFAAGIPWATPSLKTVCGADRILVTRPERSPRGEALHRALRGLDELLPADGTLLVLPEGVGLNYWLRRPNSTRYGLFLPVEIDAFGGDEAMLRNIRAHPPDFIALLHRDHAEFGVGPFGVDPRNGRGIMSWVSGSYRRVGRIGAEPFRKRGFGVVILERAERSEGERPR